MSQSSWQQQQHHLDSLQGMVNAVLIETGKALRSANANGVKTIGHTHGRIKASLPTALDKFHLALDELESDIVRAQAVLSRDLKELRAKQHELDNPTIREAEDSELPKDANGIAKTSNPESPGVVGLTSGGEPEDKVALPNIPDHLVQVSSPELKVEASSDTKSAVLDPAAQIQATELPQESADGQTANSFVTDDILKISNEASLPEGSAGLGIDLSGEEPSGSLEVPAQTGVQSESFDSMFDIGTAGDTDLNFDDFDFNTGHETHDYDQNDQDLDLSSFGNQEPSNKNDDVSTLLQGLESYGDGNGAEDFNPPELSNNATTNQVGGIQDGLSTADDYGLSGGDLDMAMGIGNNDSTFDDLLEGMNMDFEGDASGEFDDAFFAT